MNTPKNISYFNSGIRTSFNTTAAGAPLTLDVITGSSDGNSNCHGDTSSLIQTVASPSSSVVVTSVEDISSSSSSYDTLKKIDTMPLSQLTRYQYPPFHEQSS